MKKYPEQSPYVTGNKIWLDLGNKQQLIISPQAREVIAFCGINEEIFVQKLKELLKTCSTDLEYPFHRISVSKASVPDTSDEYSEDVFLRISIKDRWGSMKKK